MFGFNLPYEVEQKVEAIIAPAIQEEVKSQFTYMLMKYWEDEDLEGLFQRLYDKAENPEDINIVVLYMFSHLLKSGKVEIEFKVDDKVDEETPVFHTIFTPTSNSLPAEENYCYVYNGANNLTLTLKTEENKS